MINETIFKAYDIRGTYPNEVNEETFKRIAGAYAVFTGVKEVAVGRDVRISSPALQKAFIEGLTEAGVNVIDIGMGPTEMIYFAVGSLELDGGVQISASHNPAEYNGLKMIRRGVEAISSDNGLIEIRGMAVSDQDFSAPTQGTVSEKNLKGEYLEFMARQVDLSALSKLKVVANNNFGASGPLAKELLQKIAPQVELVELDFAPDGTFPKGRPDPLLDSNRIETSETIRLQKADMGVAWDADGDRCYIVDENGEFIEGCHMTALLAQHLLKKHPGEKIIYDPRNVWAIQETVKDMGGIALMNKAGHTFIKNRMKQEDAYFAGEMSGHFYFLDFFHADSGLLPFLFFLEAIGQSGGKKVSQIAKPMRDNYFVSGEVNFTVRNIMAAMKEVEERFSDGKIDRTDGLSVEHDAWRFNLRPSNTEPLLRLNVEARTQEDCDLHADELKKLLATHAH
jgi:phosphomannomutase